MLDFFLIFLISLLVSFLIICTLRRYDKRLEVLERIILDKSKVVINLVDFEAYCSAKFARPNNLEGNFKFNPDGTFSKVGDIDVKED